MKLGCNAEGAAAMPAKNGRRKFVHNAASSSNKPFGHSTKPNVPQQVQLTLFDVGMKV